MFPQASLAIGSCVSMASALRRTVINTTDTPVDDQAASGYMDIGEMRIQWGRGFPSSGILNITFPAAFADTSYSIVSSVNNLIVSNNAPDALIAVGFGNLTTTGAVAESAFTTGGATAPSGSEIFWQAIGLRP